jgi:hypothetical protein
MTILPLLAGAGAQLFGFDVGNQVGHGLLHHARRLHHLGQEHLAGAEQVADHVHAGHQRAFDHRQRRLACGFERGAHFLGIGDHELGDALDQRVGQAGLDGLLAPGQICAGFLGLPSFTVWANSTSASPAPGWRLSTTSSTLSRSSGSRSSYTPSWPALTMPMLMPALMA